MNIETVAANLRAIIAGKERLFVEYQEVRKEATMVEDIALYATCEMLKESIAELGEILADVEACCTRALG